MLIRIETLLMNITRLSGFINTSTQSSTNRFMLTVALKDYHMLIGEFLLKQDGVVVRVRALRPNGLRFESRSLPMLLMEVSSPYIDPSLPTPT